MTAPPATGRPRRAWTAIAVGVLVIGAAAAWVAMRPHSPPTGPQGNATPLVPEPSSAGPGWFRDVTTDSGLDFNYRNGEEANQFAILESLGGGVALIDYDGDGLLDVFVTGGGYFDGPNKTDIKGHPCRLFKNLGGFKFKDVTKEAGLDRDWWYTHGVAVADYDRDGWPDLLVTGYGKLALFHNESDGMGGRRFRDMTAELGLNDTLWSTSAGWADLDGDGFPDLYVCHYVDWSFANHPVCKGSTRDVPRDICNPEVFKPLVHSLYHNEKGKGFRDIAGEQRFKPDGCGLGVVLADLNGDGRPDAYVANDTNLNYLLFNRGGKLEAAGLVSGAAADESGHPDGSMGVDVGDYDGSGRPAIFVTNFQNEVHALYQNAGRELFRHQSRLAGVAALSRQYVGFGAGFVDYDNDGYLDLVFVNGHVWRYPVAGTPKQRPVLMKNVDQDGRRFFRDVSAAAGPFFRTPNLGRGMAIGDLDNDGWPDLVVSHTNSPVAILRNEAREQHPTHRWLGVRLVGKGNRDVVGSTVTAEVGGRTLTRFAKGGGSYLSAGDPRLLFGLGDSTGPVKITVRWSWGESQTWDGLEPGTYWELWEGESQAKRR